MSGNMSFDEFQQSELLDKLDLGFTAFLIISGILTFPPAIFVYFRIMTLPTFRTQFLMKLFVFNGAMNILFYLMNLATTQFTNWPSTHGLYTWLNRTIIPPILRFLQDFASCAQWQSQFCISFNRLLSMKHDFLLKTHGRTIYIVSLSSSSLLSLVLCIPIFFSGYQYFEIEVGDGVYAYVPGGVEGSAPYYLPSQIHQLGFAIVTLLINVITCVVLIVMRRDFKTDRRSRPEQGLLLSSFCSTFVHILNDAVLLVVFSANLVGLSYSITLFIAIATTLPFWTMIGLAHTMRRAVFSGTAFDSITSVSRWTQSQSSYSLTNPRRN